MSVSFVAETAEASQPCETGCIADLVLRCGRGDREALLGLMDLFYSAARATAASNVAAHEVDRSIEETFVALWHNAPTFRSDRDSAVDFVMSHVTTSAQRGSLR